MGRAIFISYRRDDTEGEAGRLFDDLTRSFKENSVFMDVDGINPGMDFRKAIDDNVSSCGVLLAMIGPTWSSITNSAARQNMTFTSHSAAATALLRVTNMMADAIAISPNR